MLTFFPSGANLQKETEFKSQKLQHSSGKDNNQQLSHFEVCIKGSQIGVLTP